jgi:hypothetical protein
MLTILSLAGGTAPAVVVLTGGHPGIGAGSAASRMRLVGEPVHLVRQGAQDRLGSCALGGLISHRCTSPKFGRAADLGLRASPQNPHKYASTAGGPHKNPTYRTALPGTRRHGC